MTHKPPLTAKYSSGRFLVVDGHQQKQELRLLGYFGQDLQSAKRKDDERIGPLDRLLLEKVEVKQSDISTTTVLTLYEAYYLAYAFGCLSVILPDDSRADLDTLWNTFRNYNLKSNSNLDFAIEYGVYHYFRSRGWTVKPGDNYGANFLLYREGPQIDHAQYAVHILHEDQSNQQTSCDWKTLLANHRVIQSVCKELLLVYVIFDTAKSTLDKPSCIRDLSLTVDIFSCKTNLMV